jgi:DNA-directed RNA polymerase specialized sigma24 family protein
MARRTTAPLPPFERIVEAHGPAVLRFCAAQAGPVRADDCFQETMLAALRAYDGVRDPEAIPGWLFAIAARKAVDLHRAQARAGTPAGAALDGAAEPAPPAGLPRDDGLWARVRALPDKQRTAVGLRFVADLSHAEIAAAMGTSEPAARRNVFEGLQRLRKEMRP